MDSFVHNPRLKVLMVHNSYQQPGGEDVVCDAERELLAGAGHEVFVYRRQNDEIGQYGLIKKVSLSIRTVWAWDSASSIRRLIQRERPDIAHFHNTFPLISPAAYYACNELGIPVVQSLHNPRLLCPAATFHRGGQVCQDCLGRRIAWPGVIHGCYRNSRIETGAVAAMLAFHSYLKTWERLVDVYIVFSEFYRRIFVQGGFPAARIDVKPHFVAPDPGQATPSQGYALFVGRLSPEKGVLTLVEAWKRLKSIPIRIRGEGPLLSRIRESNHGCGVDLVPRLPREKLIALFQGAGFLVWPSEGFYETFGLVAVEAFACGVPVIASRLGVMAEIVRDQETGLHFTPGDPDDLAAKVEWAVGHPKEMARMGKRARVEYEAKYTAERNYELLIDIYRRALSQRSRQESLASTAGVAAKSAGGGMEASTEPWWR